MNDFLPSLLLVICGIVALVALVIAYLWYFVFGRSMRAILMTGLSLLMNRDSEIDLDADVELEKRPEQAKEEIAHEVEALDFEGSITTHDQYVPQVDTEDSGNFGAQAVDVQPEKQDFVSSSFTSGRFRRVKQIFTRPFLKMRINSQSDIPAKNIIRGADSTDSE